MISVDRSSGVHNLNKLVYLPDTQRLLFGQRPSGQTFLYAIMSGMQLLLISTAVLATVNALEFPYGLLSGACAVVDCRHLLQSVDTSTSSTSIRGALVTSTTVTHKMVTTIEQCSGTGFGQDPAGPRRTSRAVTDLRYAAGQRYSRSCGWSALPRGCDGKRHVEIDSCKRPKLNSISPPLARVFRSCMVVPFHDKCIAHCELTGRRKPSIPAKSVGRCFTFELCSVSRLPPPACVLTACRKHGFLGLWLEIRFLVIL